MAAHTIIIDLFGIPACGKTTLTEYLSNEGNGEIRIATLPESLRDNKVGWKLLRSVSLKIIWKGLMLRFAAPFDKKRREVSLFNMLKYGFYYKYILKYSKYDIVLVDHGEIQSFVTLERGDDLHKDKRFVRACSRYIDSSLASIYVYCKLEAEEAFNRMHKRRRGNGRIDVIKDERQQLDELQKEKSRFDFSAELLKEKKRVFLELDMDYAPPVIAEKLMNYCENLKKVITHII